MLKLLTTPLPRYKDVGECRAQYPEGQFTPVTNTKFDDYRHIIWTAGDEEDLRGVFDALKTPPNVQKCVKFVFERYRTAFYVALIWDGERYVCGFVPMNNYYFSNPYHTWMHLDPKINLEKLQQFKPDVMYEKDKKKWYATGFLVRFDYTPYKPSDPYEFYYYEMQQFFAEVAKRAPHRRDRYDFIVQYRDYQIVRDDNTDPLYHITGQMNKPLPEQPYTSKEMMEICPVLGFSSCVGYMDKPIPTPDDVTAVFGLVVPPSCRTSSFPPLVSWETRIPKAVFRGMATGAGLTVDTNQRLKLWKVTRKWPEMFDVGIVGVPKRFKKIYGERYIKQNNPFDFETKKRVPIAQKLSYDEQFRYKMMIYVEGNSGAYRLGTMLASKCCILKVESKFAMWFERYLVPWKHYVPVKEDMSDLIDRMRWCLQNDSNAREIGENAAKLYNEMFTEQSLCDWFVKELMP